MPIRDDIDRSCGMSVYRLKYAIFRSSGKLKTCPFADRESVPLQPAIYVPRLHWVPDCSSLIAMSETCQPELPLNPEGSPLSRGYDLWQAILLSPIRIDDNEWTQDFVYDDTSSAGIGS